MKQLLVSVAAVGSLSLGGCATGPSSQQVGTAASGAVIGAAGGAIAGSILPGIGTGAGAAVGAVLGGVVGAVVGGRQYYRDTRGYCYYVDQYGQPHYNYKVRC